MPKKVDYRTNEQKQRMRYLQIFIIIVVALFILILLIRALSSIEKEPNYDEETDTVGFANVKDYSSLAQLLAKYNCTYVSESETISLLTVYVFFDVDLYTGNTSNETYFMNIIYAVAEYEDYINFELLDEQREIYISVTCEDLAIVQIEINGDVNYYLNEDTKRNLANMEETPITDFKIQSKELRDLIQNDWNPSDVSLGTKDSSVSNYDIYFDEGYKIKTVGRTVFNLVYTTKYTGSIVSGLNANSTEDEIIDTLGDPTFTSGTNMYGYLGDKNYVFFDLLNEQVSIYPVQKITEEDEDKFIELINLMNESNDVKQFGMDLTSLWTDYDVYDYDSNYVDLRYTLKGICLNINSDSLKNGIYIYKNYAGDINSIIGLDNVYVKSDDFVYNEEYSRMMNESQREYVADLQENENSSLYMVEFLESNSKSYIRFLSTDLDARPDVEIQTDAETYIWISESEIVYGEKNNGIYYFNVPTQKQQQLVSGDDENFEIESYENNILRYDDVQIELNF